jgi:hypothetical protein
MSDAEWEALRSNWTGAEGPLPDVRARALQQSSRHRRANVVFFALMAGGALVTVWAAVVERADPYTCWGLILWGAAVSIGIVWIQRGIRLAKTVNPREALSFLERRVRVERQGAQIFRWAYAAGILFVAIHFRDLFGDEWRVKLVARCILALIFAFTFSAPWWIRRFTDPQQDEIARLRRWMDEQQL